VSEEISEFHVHDRLLFFVEFVTNTCSVVKTFHVILWPYIHFINM